MTVPLTSADKRAAIARAKARVVIGLCELQAGQRCDRYEAACRDLESAKTKLARITKEYGHE